MLVLSRKRGQRIVVGEGDSEVVITVVGWGDAQVRLGFDAPKDVPIHRLEVHEAIKRGKADAA